MSDSGHGDADFCPNGRLRNHLTQISWTSQSLHSHLTSRSCGTNWNQWFNSCPKPWEISTRCKPPLDSWPSSCSTDAWSILPKAWSFQVAFGISTKRSTKDFRWQFFGCDFCMAKWCKCHQIRWVSSQVVSQEPVQQFPPPGRNALGHVADPPPSGKTTKRSAAFLYLSVYLSIYLFVCRIYPSYVLYNVVANWKRVK